MIFIFYFRIGFYFLEGLAKKHNEKADRSRNERLSSVFLCVGLGLL